MTGMADVALNPAMVRELDRLPLDDIVVVYGPGELTTEYAQGIGWHPGDGTPALVADGPAVAQAMGRCAAARIRGVALDYRAIHPGACGWCDYPIARLIEALDHATWVSRYVTTEYLSWRAKGGDLYTRGTGRSGTYEHPEWARWWMQLPGHRARQVEAAAGREPTPNAPTTAPHGETP